MFSCVCVCACVFILRVRVEVKVDSWCWAGSLFQWSSVCSKLWRPRPPNLPHHHPLPSSRLLLLSLTNPVFSNCKQITHINHYLETFFSKFRITAYLLVFILHCEFLLFHLLKLITEIEFGGLLLQFGEFVLIFGYFSQRWFDTKFAMNRMNTKIITVSAWKKKIQIKIQKKSMVAYNLPRRSLTRMLISLICHRTTSSKEQKHIESPRLNNNYAKSERTEEGLF